MGGREVSRPYWVGFSPKASGFCFWSRPWIIKGWGHEKSVEVHPLRTSTPTKPCNSVILVIFFPLLGHLVIVIVVISPRDCACQFYSTQAYKNAYNYRSKAYRHYVKIRTNINRIHNLIIRLKIVLQMYGNILTKSIRFPPFGVRLRVFWCVTYIEIVHLNTCSTAKSLKSLQFAVKPQKCVGYFWFFQKWRFIL